MPVYVDYGVCVCVSVWGGGGGSWIFVLQNSCTKVTLSLSGLGFLSHFAELGFVLSASRHRFELYFLMPLTICPLFNVTYNLPKLVTILKGFDAELKRDALGQIKRRF